MAYTPPAHTPQTWFDSPSTATAVSAANLTSAEVDLVTYTKDVIQDYDTNYAQATYTQVANNLSDLASIDSAAANMRNKTPRGTVSTPEKHGAVGDGVIFTDGAITAGSSALTSAKFTTGSLPNGAGSKRIYIAWAGAGTSAGTTSSGLSTGSPITTIPRTTGAAVPAGPIMITSGSHAQMFFVPNNVGSNTSITVSSQTPNFAFGSGSALKFGNAGMSTTISSVGTGTATLGANATNTVNNIVGWFGTDDSAAFRSAIADVDGQGGTVLLDNKNYVLDSAPVTSGNTNAVVPLAGGLGVQYTVQGVNGIENVGFSAFHGTYLMTTRITDTYSGTFGSPSLLGGPTPEQSGSSLGPTPTLKDFKVLLPDNPSIAAIDMSRCEGAVVDHVSVVGAGAYLGGPYGQQGQTNTSVNAFALWLPMTSNGGDVRVNKFNASNMYVGVVLSEHTVLNHVLCFNCVQGVGFPNTGGSGHANSFVYLDIEGCNYGLAGYDQTGGGAISLTGSNANYFYGFVDFEDQGSQWAVTDHILDANNKMVGKLVVYRFFGAVTWPLTTSGAAFVDVKPLSSPKFTSQSVQVFTASGTWTKPPGATFVDVSAIGGGGGGQSGSTAASGSVSLGGIGGGGAGIAKYLFNANDLGSTVSVTVGAGGAGGTGISSNNTSGGWSGKTGANSLFGSILQANGGGESTGGLGGNARIAGNAGGSPSGSGGAGGAAGGGISGAGGGGAGAGVTTGPAASSGGNGGASGDQNNGGTGGTSGGTGVAGTAVASANMALGGGGGGGGASSTSAGGGTGGAGAIYGGGGGGGGACLNTHTSGAGGQGANGVVVVISW